MTGVLLGGLIFSGTALFLVFVRSLRPVSLSERLTADSRKQISSGELLYVLNSILKKAFEPKKKMQQILFELPDFLDLMSVALSGGEGIHSALSRIVPRMRGELAAEFTLILNSLNVGASLDGELAELAKRVPQQQLVETCNKLISGMRRGTPLASVLSEQSDAVRDQLSNHLLKLAGKNETRMLVPLVFLILPVTVLFAIYPSLQLLNINYL